MLDWSAAAAAARSLAEGWQAEAGPGGAIVLFDRDGLCNSFSGGFADLAHRLPFTADTQCRFASISKHLLATALLQAGLSLDSPLGTWLEDLPDAIAAVPLGRALDMTGALPDMMEVFWQQGVPFTATLSATEIGSALRRLPGLNGPPGGEMAYSNTGWRLAQAVIEQCSGQDYAEVVARLVAPVDPSIRFIADESETVPGLATGYFSGGATWRRGRYGFNFSASGGIAGSAAGLARWCAALLAGRGALEGMLPRLGAVRRFVDGTESAYRLGLVATRLGGTALFGHGGSLPGYRNHMLIAPEAGIGVVVMMNREEDAHWPALRILAALLSEDLPKTADEVPTGLYAAESGPFWAELSPGAISVMGGYERLVEAAEGGWRSLPAYLDLQLRQAGDGRLDGVIGGAARSLLPVPGDQPLDAALPGLWRERSSGVTLLIRPDGSALMPWAATIGRETRLTPLPGARALADLGHGPWRHRPCLWLQPDGRLGLASHRARIHLFDRI